jgi:drug efflux transport system permease protein
MNIRRIKALAKKEFILVTRDTRSLIAAIFIPLLMIFLFGYALSLDVDRIPLLIVDQDKTPSSRELIQRLGDSRYFNITRYLDRTAEIEPALNRSEALMALVIPAGYSSLVKEGVKSPVQVIFDGSDSNTASIASGYFQAVINGLNMQLQAARLKKAGFKMADIPLEPRIRVWFNPELKSRNFIIPGLTAIIINIICTFLTSLLISRERETGTLEQLISTPITGGELLVGKLLPFIGVGMTVMVLVAGAGILIFDVPFRGSYIDLFLATLLFLIGTLSWGLLISVVSKNQLQASQIAMLSVMLPSFLLSGFIYPIENMPVVLQAITYIVPARYCVEILKGLFLEGIGLSVLWRQYLALAAYAFLILTVARRRFGRRLL